MNALLFKKRHGMTSSWSDHGVIGLPLLDPHILMAFCIVFFFCALHWMFHAEICIQGGAGSMHRSRLCLC